MMNDRMLFMCIKVMLISFILAGLVAILLGIAKKITYNKKYNSYIETEATIVRYYSEEYGDHDIKAAVYEYVIDGQTYQTISKKYSKNPKAEVGTKKTIRYNPKNPESIIEKYSVNCSFYYIFGGVFAGVGLFILLIMSNIEKKENKA